jgi:hypothetical protein
MVDYSKWDNIIDSDSEEERERQQSKKPKVTTIKQEKGAKVTIGPQGYQIHGEEEEEQSSLPSFHEVNKTILENERKREVYSDEPLEEEYEEGDAAEKENENEDSLEQAEYYELKRQLHEQEQKEKEKVKEMEKLKTSLAQQTVFDSKLKESFNNSSEISKNDSTVTEPLAQSEVKIKDRQRNGGEGHFQSRIPYEWSQTKQEVNLFLYFPFEELKKTVSALSDGNTDLMLNAIHSNSLKKKDFHVVYGEESRELQISYRFINQKSKQTEMISVFKGKLSYDVEITGEVDNPYDDMVDWNLTMCSSSTSFSSVSLQQMFNSEGKDTKDILVFEFLLKKKLKIANAVIWWKNVFEGEPEIDLSTIKDRTKGYAEFMTNFQLAQEQFQEKIKNFEKVEI